MEEYTNTDSLYTGSTEVSENEVSDSVFYETEDSDAQFEDSETQSDELDTQPEDSDVESDESDTQSEDSEIESDESDTQPEDFDTQYDSNGNFIDVDGDFGGDLESAISAANEGDVVKLGDNTYYTSGITIDKNITLEGQGNSVIDGGGTSDTIITLTSEADGAIIRGIEITNGNNGIYGYGASDLTLENLDVNNIGIDQTIRQGQNNTGISLGDADGLRLMNSNVENIGRKAVSVGDTDGATITGLTVSGVNLAAQHSQSHDAAGVKFFNTNDILLSGSQFSDINAINIWNDTTNGTVIRDNVVQNVGEDFAEPDFNSNVQIYGIYNEKSSNATIENNQVTAVDDFLAFNATDFSTQTMNLGSNDFSSSQTGSTDYWVNQAAEQLIATTENPQDANFSLFSGEYYSQANIG